MQRFTRTFALVGGMLMFAAAAALSWHLHTAATRSALALAQDYNVGLARVLGNAMHERILGLIENPPPDPRQHPHLPRFHADVVEQLRGLNIVKVKIYSRDGITVFSTEAAQIGRDYKANQGFRLALAGTIASEMTFRNQFSAFDQVIEKRNVLSSYIPISTRHGDIESVFEIYQDVTEMLAALAVRQWTQGAAILGAFGAVYILLLMMIRRAEILARQNHEEAVALAADAARAETANRTKTEFLATMSHELRTPLNAILGFSDMIRDEVLGPTGNPRYREYAGDINTSANHLLDIINDILDLARIEAGKLEVDPVPIALTHFADWASRIVRPQAEAGRVTLHCTVDPAVSVLTTDERILRQIVLNLMTNAVKFTPTGGMVTLAIRPGTADRVMIVVEDTGVGMRAEDIPRALAPFSQLDNTLSRKHRGTGLGLSLANRFVILLGGELDIRSAPGRGTTVTVTLPVGAASSLSAAA